MKNENENIIIWIVDLDVIEEYDAADYDSMIYNHKEISGLIRDVHCFDNRVNDFEVGDYICMDSSIKVNAADLWEIIKIIPTKDNNIKRLLISNVWSKINLKNYKITLR